MSNVIAGVIRGQMLYLEEHVRRKKEIYEEMFEQEMQDLMDYTGFNIEG